MYVTVYISRYVSPHMLEHCKTIYNLLQNHLKTTFIPRF